MFAAIEEHEDLSGIDPAERLHRIIGMARKPEPKHVHRRAEFLRYEARLPPHQGMAAIGSNDQIRADSQQSVWRFRGDGSHPFLFPDEPIDVRAHFEPETGVALGSSRDKIEKI